MSMMQFSLRAGSLTKDVPFGTKAQKGGTGLWFDNLDIVTVDADDVKNHIRRALHVDIRAQRQANAVLAITDPTEWLKQRKARIDKMTGTLSTFYASQLQLYYNSGYTQDEAVEKATQDANAVYERLIREIEAEFPGGEAFLGQASGSAQIDEHKYRKLKEKYKKMKANQVNTP